MKILNEKRGQYSETFWNGFVDKKRKSSSMKDNHISIFLFFLITSASFALYAADQGTCIEVCYTVYTPSRNEKKSDVLGRKITDKDYTEDLFTHSSSSLKQLKIHDHELINPLIVKAYFLTKLDLSHGTLQQFLICKHLAGMPSLSSLDLSHNKLTLINVPEEEQHSEENEVLFKHLEIVNVSHNQLHELDFNLLNRLTMLKEMDYSHNVLNSITGVPTEPRLSIYSRFCDRTMTRVMLIGNEKFSNNEESLTSYTRDLSHYYEKWLERGREIGAMAMGFPSFLGTTLLVFGLYPDHIFPVPNAEASGALGQLIGVSFASGFSAGLTTACVGALIGNLGARCIYKGQKSTKIFEFVFKDDGQLDDELISVNDSTDDNSDAESD